MEVVGFLFPLPFGMVSGRLPADRNAPAIKGKRTMNIRYLLSLICAASILAGCASMEKSAGRQYASQQYQSRPEMTQSVVNSADAAISEEGIRTLLGSKVVLPEKAKLAIVCLGQSSSMGNSWRYGGSEYLESKSEYTEAVEAPLIGLGRFTEVTYMPGILLPEKPSLVKFREAAALMQAELLLMYRIDTQQIYDQHLFSKDEVRVHATMELALLDVRTGVVPLALTLDANHVEKEVKQDVEDFETRKRADKTATLLVMAQAAEKLKTFFAAAVPAAAVPSPAGPPSLTPSP